MPTKPSQEVIEACRRAIDPREVMEVVINETPLLRQSLLSAKLVEEIIDPDDPRAPFEEARQ
jgi:hypothetical protein